MIHIKQAIIVEGKYDKIKLNEVVDAIIITTNGFQIYKDKEKLEFIRYLAQKSGIIILTDSDTSGFKIRNFIKSAVKSGNIINVYIPDIYGKEKRKLVPSKEGKLGVEGIDCKLIEQAFIKSGVDLLDKKQVRGDTITKADLFELGLTGKCNSTVRRKLLLKFLNLPELLSSNSMLEIINTMMDRTQFINLIKDNDF